MANSMPATAVMNGFDPMGSIPGVGTIGDLAGGTSSNKGGDIRTGDKQAGTIVFGNQSTAGGNTLLYIAAALAALFIFRGKK